MKTTKLFLAFFIALTTVFSFYSCDKDDDQDDVVVEVDPIIQNSKITVRNSFESAFLSIPEMPFGDTATAVVNNGVEFPGYLGFYKIDVGTSTISFELLPAAANDTNVAALFRVIEPGTYDRYYMTFDSPQNFKSATTNNNSVKATIVSNKEIKIEIGEGYNFSVGNAFFTVTLQK